MNAWVERHVTTARLACASSRPSAFRRWVLPSPLFPTSTRGLYFLPGRSSTARTALTATSLDGPTAYPLSGKAPDGPGGGATPPRDRKSTRLNSSHSQISYAVFCLKKKRHHDEPAHAHLQRQPL